MQMHTSSTFILAHPFTARRRTKSRNTYNASSVRCTSTDSARILITSPRIYSARLASLLIQQGHRPICAPCITTTALEDASSIDKIEDAILRLSTFDIVAFTSRTGIKEFARYLHQFAANDMEIVQNMVRASGVKLAALGSDATGLRDAIGHTADIVPIEASPSGLVRFMAADESLRNSHVLCPVPEVHGMPEPPIVPDFLNQLREAGFQVTSVPAYVTRPVGRGSVDVELKWLDTGFIDYVGISSVGEANALRALLTDDEYERLVHRVDKTKDIKLVAHGPFTCQGITDGFGVENVVISRDFSSFDGMVEAVGECEKERRQGTLLLPL